MCLYPTLIKNRKYIPNKKNGGVVPHLHEIKDKRVLTVPVGCGRCMECRKKKAREWQTRMLEDIRKNKNGKMVTLTFSDESIKELTEEITKKRGYEKKGYELDNEIATLAVRKFVERWRKEHKKSVRHWLVTELGHNGTENIHMHGIIWTDEPIEKINKHWKYGFTWTGTFVSEKTVNYIIKYIHKQDKDHKEYKSKILTSAGIGNNYTNRTDAKNNRYNNKGETKEYYRTRTGHKVGLPIYWRNKIYNEEEKEKLWLKKLDEQVRWIENIKIDISVNEEEYYKVLEEARAKNKRLGYQTNEIDWNKKKYEEQRRTLLQQERITRAENTLRGLGDAPESAESVNMLAKLAWMKKEKQKKILKIIWRNIKNTYISIIKKKKMKTTLTEKERLEIINYLRTSVEITITATEEKIEFEYIDHMLGTYITTIKPK